MRSARVLLPGSPDQACDILIEAMVDEYMRRDPAARVNLRVIGGHGALFVAGEVATQADFDVAALLRRTLGSLGILADIEPFISIESLPAEHLSLQGPALPLTVMGYATSETSSLIPLPLERARFLAKALQEERTANEAWFWCGPDVEVSVGITGATPTRVDIRVEHGAHPFENVRSSVAAFVARHFGTVEVHINTLGPEEVRGLGKALGASGRSNAPYGPLLPGALSSIGLDIHRVEKAGLWLTRAAARMLVLRGARAASVTATYAPGDRVPFFVLARDEKGKDLSQEIDRSSLALDRVAREWSRPNLNADAARWGFAGEAGLPWEV